MCKLTHPAAYSSGVFLRLYELSAAAAQQPIDLQLVPESCSGAGFSKVTLFSVISFQGVRPNLRSRVFNGGNFAVRATLIESDENRSRLH